MISGIAWNVLLVEDDDDHAEVVCRALKSQVQFVHVSDGEAALDYIFRRGLYADAAASPLPDVVLLDLRLPKVDGLEVLRTIKAAPQTRHIPVVILTTSESEKDIVSAYQNHANSYLVKPVNFTSFTEMMSALGLYWREWNRTPERSEK